MAEIRVSGKPIQVELISVSLAQISGPDSHVKEFLNDASHETDTPVDLDAWHPDALRMVYVQFPLILLERHGGYVYVGSGRTYRLAQSIFERDEAIPALLLRGARIQVARKLQILGAELLGLPALTRTRRRGPRRLLRIWRGLGILGIETIRGDSEVDFSRGTGYSRKALVTPSEDVENAACEQESAGARP